MEMRRNRAKRGGPLTRAHAHANVTKREVCARQADTQENLAVSHPPSFLPVWGFT